MANEYGDLDPISLNISGASDLVESKVNRVSRTLKSGEEGPVGPQKDVLELDMTDEELLFLANQMSSAYAGYEGKIKPKQQANKRYYLGNQKAAYAPYATDDTPIAANYIFPSIEIFLAAALAKNPDPIVWSDNTPEGQALADDTQTMLQFHADQLSLRRKLARMARQWSMCHLGVLKHGWDTYQLNGKETGDITVELRRIENFVFDPNGYVDVDGDFIGSLGERIKISADELIKKFPESKEYIVLSVDGKLGTEVMYTEWWTDDYTFSTYLDLVLDKSKNPFFNYKKGGRNHFAKPKKPFTFLSIFSLGTQPHDITGLIEQNIPNQNLISKRTQQIDYNISRNNNSTAFSENNFNQQTAKQATQAWIKGHNILVPAGVPISEAIANFPATPLPESFFKDLQNSIATLQSSMGIQGLTAQPTDENTTARGMILNQQRDNTRIGGAINESIEQVAKNVFNWFVQEYYVFYDVKHFGSVLGMTKAVEYAELSASSMDRQLIVTVAPDSMKPKDEITAMNQAQQLWEGEAIGLKTYLTLQKISDPQEAAEDALLWKAGLQPYIQVNYPDLWAQLQQLQSQQAGTAQPAQSNQAPAPAAATGEPQATGGEPPNASLSQVSLPK